MATQPDLDDEDFTEDARDLNLDDEDEQDAAADDEAEGAKDEADGGDTGDGGDAAGGDEDADVITFGGNAIADEDEPEHIADLRKRYREQQRLIRELQQANVPQREALGPKPNMDDYWDRDDPAGDFERDLLAFHNRRAEAEREQAQQREQQTALQREWETDVAELETQRSSLKVRDYDSAYDRVTGVLSEAQQSILVQVAKNKAALVYALGKNPDRLDQIAKQGNLAKFAGEVARLDMETRVSRKPTTAPERTVRGSGGSFNGKAQADARTARLERDAEKTGDYSALVAHQRKMEKK